MHNPVKNWRRQRELRHQLNKTGTVLAFTTIYVAKAEYQKQTPYTVVMAEMEDGSTVYGQLKGIAQGNIKHGMKVRSTLRSYSYGKTNEDVITYGLKFVPLEE